MPKLAALFLLSILANSACAGQNNMLELAFMHGNKQQRDNFTAVIRNFTAETGIPVRLSAYTDHDYKIRFPRWLAGDQPPDVLYWQGGERLLAYVRSGAVQPLDDLWQVHSWSASFGQSMQNAVSWQGHVYALPYSYYHWGLFYSRSTLQKVGLQPPVNWSELLQSCKILRQHGITPLVLGAKEYWPALAWFDYLNLRLNGLAFHSQLTRGEIDYRDERVRDVFRHWQQLIEADCFNHNTDQLDWNDGISFLYYGKAGMTLMGSFAVPDSRSTDILTLPFPTLRAEMPRYEDAPLDLFLLPSQAQQHTAEAKQLLVFLARPEVQQQLNQKLGTFSPHTAVQQELSALQQASKHVLTGAAGFAQYFDRDIPPEFDRAASPIIARFANTPDIEATLQLLEQLRQRYYAPTAQ